MSEITKQQDSRRVFICTPQQEIKVGEIYYFRQIGKNGYGENSILYDDVVITDLYEGINGIVVSFKQRDRFFPQKYVCSYQQFLEGIVRKIQ